MSRRPRRIREMRRKNTTPTRAQRPDPTPPPPKHRGRMNNLASEAARATERRAFPTHGTRLANAAELAAK